MKHHLPHLGQAEINKDGSDTKDDLENDKNNDDSFESFSVRGIDTLLEEFKHVLKNLFRQEISTLEIRSQGLTSTRALRRSTR